MKRLLNGLSLDTGKDNHRTMLRNIIFDMGRVLIQFDPSLFLDRLGIQDDADRQILIREIFSSPEWPMMDTGELTEEQMEEIVLQRLPSRLRVFAHKLIFEWDQPIVPVPGMATLIEECKNFGLGIYLLSNASIRQKDYWSRIPGHEFFDGRVVSAEVRCVKPNPEIYRYLLDTYNLKAEECLFVDDMQANVDAAEKEGIKGYLFDGDERALRKTISRLIVKG